MINEAMKKLRKNRSVVAASGDRLIPLTVNAVNRVAAMPYEMAFSSVSRFAYSFVHSVPEDYELPTVDQQIELYNSGRTYNAYINSVADARPLVTTGTDRYQVTHLRIEGAHQVLVFHSVMSAGIPERPVLISVTDSTVLASATRPLSMLILLSVQDMKDAGFVFENGVTTNVTYLPNIEI